MHQLAAHQDLVDVLYEMLKVCLDDQGVSQLFLVAEDMARGTTSKESRIFLLATMTAISKRDGGVRGIATGTALRRLVSKTLARQFGAEVEKVCASFQFALSTRAGTDCVGHAIWAITDANPRATVLSIDGIGAYDHVLRSAMLTKLAEVPQLHGLIPFVRSVYASPTTYAWEDEEVFVAREQGTHSCLSSSVWQCSILFAKSSSTCCQGSTSSISWMTCRRSSCLSVHGQSTIGVV